MKTTVPVLIASVLLSVPAIAEELTFDFKDPKGVNTITFKTDAPLEQISGNATGVSGTIAVDTENPANVRGKIAVDGSSMHVPHPTMKGHLHGDGWLDIKRHPQILFEVKEVKNVQRDGNAGTADVIGTFTLKGVSKEITVPVKATYLPGRLKDRGGKVDGDLLVLRTNFTVKRSEFNIQPGQNEDKVADEIEVSVAIAGAAPKG
jgi:polyisoprenoid-binding protein YceI